MTDRHTIDHDPVFDYPRCVVCNDLLRRSFNALADLPLGPKDVDALMMRIRAGAKGWAVTA